MEKILFTSFLLLLSISYSNAATNVDINLNVGTPPVVIREIPQQNPNDYYDDPPEFVFSNRLGFYIAVGIPLDIVYVDGIYWLYRDNGWHRGFSYNGPWHRVKHKHIPWGLRKHDIVIIREHRDREYVTYRSERESYKGRHFRPEHHLKMNKEKRHYREERINEKKRERPRGERKWKEREEGSEHREKREHGRKGKD